jgi:hypothetical protein
MTTKRAVVRTTVADRNGSCPQQFGLWEPKTPLTIAPTKTYDEMVRLLGAMDEHFDSGRRCVFCEGKGGMHQEADAEMGRKDCPAVALRALLATWTRWGDGDAEGITVWRARAGLSLA